MRFNRGIRRTLPSRSQNANVTSDSPAFYQSYSCQRRSGQQFQLANPRNELALPVLLFTLEAQSKGS
jgi:hypothetical protein